MEGPMPHVSDSEETVRRLAARAVALNISVDELVQPALDWLAETGASPAEPPLRLTRDAWRMELEAWNWKRDAQSRAGRDSPGFVVDDSRETIDRGREDARL